MRTTVIKTMPVQDSYSRTGRKHLTCPPIPWGMLEAHDQQAKYNHAGQDLERLRERHGISPCEALAIMEDRPWTKLDLEWSYEELARRIKAWEKERVDFMDCHDLLRDSEKMVDVSSDPNANIEHLQNVLVGYRDHVRNRSTRSDFSPDGARDISWKLGRNLAEFDLNETKVPR